MSESCLWDGHYKSKCLNFNSKPLIYTAEVKNGSYENHCTVLSLTNFTQNQSWVIVIVFMGLPFAGFLWPVFWILLRSFLFSAFSKPPVVWLK